MRDSTHWSSQSERASNWGIAFLISLMKFTGPGFIKLVVIPVSLYYFLTSPDTRKVSREYIKRLEKMREDNGKSVNLPGGFLSWTVFRHMLNFSQSMVDRIYSWNSKEKAVKYEVEGREIMDSVLNVDSQGAIIFVSHLGNFDLAIARTNLTPNKRFNIIMDTSHTRTYNNYRDKIFDSSQVRFIEPSEITPLVTMDLVNRTANGEVVFIAADRTVSSDSKNTVLAEFLGDLAAFPIGPYIMAHLLEVPAYIMFSVQRSNLCLIRFEAFEDRISISRQDRDQAIRRYAQKFACRLELACFEFPLQWYNFYDFWVLPEATEHDR